MSRIVRCSLIRAFCGPYVCAEQATRRYDFTELVPDGPTVGLMCDLARQKFCSRPGSVGHPVFDLGFVKTGVYICHGRYFPEGAVRERDEVRTADRDLELIAEVRKTRQFLRDRRPHMYETLVKA